MAVCLKLSAQERCLFLLGHLLKAMWRGLSGHQYCAFGMTCCGCVFSTDASDVVNNHDFEILRSARKCGAYLLSLRHLSIPQYCQFSFNDSCWLGSFELVNHDCCYYAILRKHNHTVPGTLPVIVTPGRLRHLSVKILEAG